MQKPHALQNAPVKTHSHLLELADGTLVPYALPGETTPYSSWYRTFDTKFVHTYHSKIKASAIRLGGWNTKKAILYNNKYTFTASTTRLIYADFDTHPHTFKNFDEFYDFISYTFKASAVTIRSFNNKVKIIFQVKTIQESITKKDALRFLKKILPLELFNHIDQTDAALKLSFIKAKDIKELRKLKYKTVHNLLNIIEDNTNYLSELKDTLNNTSLLKPLSPSPVGGYTLVEEHKYRTIKNNLFIHATKHIHKNNPQFIQFMYILLASSQLLYSNGFDIPTTKVAKQVGVSQRTVSSWRYKLERTGILKCINRYYMPGVKAYTYTATGILKRFLHKLHKKTKARTALPTYIKDGTWYETLWYYSYRFRFHPKDFLAWIQRVRGHDRKTRPRIALNAIVSRLKYLDKSYSELSVDMPSNYHMM